MDGGVKIVPKNWRDFQHYKDRNPPWIRLHKSLLDNYEFQCLPVASRALAPMLWLLASDSVDGVIDATAAKLAFRLRMSESDVRDALKPLIDNGFFAIASGVLAECPQVAVPETETEALQKKTPSPSAPRFEAFWKAYPKKVAKDAALKAFLKRKPDDDLLARMLKAIETQSRSEGWRKNGGEFIPNPATWLNETRWLDEGVTLAAVPAPKQSTWLAEQAAHKALVDAERAARKAAA
jgi:hypothetical protein